MLHRHRLPLSPLGVETVVITGVSTENCCHATARDALLRDYRVVLLSSATATFDYPDVGQDGRAAAEVHRATPVILVGSTAHVMTAEEFMRARQLTTIGLRSQLDRTRRCQEAPI